MRGYESHSATSQANVVRQATSSYVYQESKEMAVQNIPISFHVKFRIRTICLPFSSEEKDLIFRRGNFGLTSYRNQYIPLAENDER